MGGYIDAAVKKLRHKVHGMKKASCADLQEIERVTLAIDGLLKMKEEWQNA